MRNTAAGTNVSGALASTTRGWMSIFVSLLHTRHARILTYRKSYHGRYARDDANNDSSVDIDTARPRRVFADKSALGGGDQELLRTAVCLDRLSRNNMVATHGDDDVGLATSMNSKRGIVLNTETGSILSQ